MRLSALLIASLFLFSLATGASAMNQYGYAPARSSAELPGDKLREGIDRITAYLARGENRNPAELAAFIDKEIAPYFDFSRMARWIAGRSYPYLDPAQRAAFEKTVSEMFMAAMVRQIAGFGYEKVRYLRPRGNPRSGQITLSLMAYSKTGQPTRISFRMYRGRDGWKVYDVSSNGQSAVGYYRQYFARKLQQMRPRSRRPAPEPRYPGRYGYPAYQYR
ncbi:MAG TPA: ABC transporter substrate-binding protein [Chromatiales bacterium]|nr:ABC transporter substrate-binding protein [Chromatiales bacterium]